MVPVEGDGNCLFRSVSHQVYGDDRYHGLVRARCMDYMEVRCIKMFFCVAAYWHLFFTFFRFHLLFREIEGRFNLALCCVVSSRVVAMCARYGVGRESICQPVGTAAFEISSRPSSIHVFTKTTLVHSS